MIEALPVLLVLVIAVASYAAAKIHVSNQSAPDGGAELTRLTGRQVWLRSRLEQAWREKWDRSMVHRIAGELESTETELKILSSQVKKMG